MKTSHLIADITSGIEDIPVIKTTSVDMQIRDKIAEWPADHLLKGLILSYWFTKDRDVGIEIWSARSIVKTEEKCANLKAGYLQIGECPNGDRVYLKESDFSVWYWSHDEASDWKKIQKGALYLVYPSIDYLLISIRNQWFIPRDSYSAREHYELYRHSYGDSKSEPKK